jgi:hypothetical protein
MKTIIIDAQLKPQYKNQVKKLRARLQAMGWIDNKTDEQFTVRERGDCEDIKSLNEYTTQFKPYWKKYFKL